MGVIIRLLIVLSFCLAIGIMVAHWVPGTLTLVFPQWNQSLRWIHVIVVGAGFLGTKFTVSK